ncbi:MAG: nickel pincer cofactor biosynthesis protein LarB [Euryarchaeota archaeon]|nr:nickel pincer cofactor biosynthesis protein LarB [Euryarchaeota archaeon]
MDDTLRDLAAGRITVEEARRALSIHAVTDVGDFGRFDTHRDIRTGIPEVILGEGKAPAEVRALVEAACSVRGQAIVSRFDTDALDSSGLEESDLILDHHATARFLVARTVAFNPPEPKGVVGIVTAGTSDLPVAHEARMMAEGMGARTVLEADCGVAGPARLAPALSRVLEADPGALVVAAGREGTLPTVVSALVPVPVIGLPVSSGYGEGGKGKAALYSMLQSCSPLAVVNIDNGVMAGQLAARIARLASR